PDQVGCYPDFRVEYYASLTEDGEYVKMDEAADILNLYVTWNKLDAALHNNVINEAVLYYACKNANGLSNINEIIFALWNPFTTRQLNQLDFGLSSGQPLTYYYDTYPSNIDMPHVTDNDCVGWMGLFADILSYIGLNNGVDFRTESIQTKNNEFGIGGISEGFLVKNWVIPDNHNVVYSCSISGQDYYTEEYIFSTYTDHSQLNSLGMQRQGHRRHPLLLKGNVVENPGIEGQGELNPVSTFVSHSVVVIGNEIYDPSYGKKYTSIQDFQQRAVDGFYIGTKTKKIVEISGTAREVILIYFRKNENNNDFKPIDVN
ncbi:MAG: hypothetical protein ACOCVN_02870, partial [bacterium]